MRIAGSSIAFQATHQQVKRHEEQAHVRFWVDNTARTARRKPADRVDLSDKGKHKCECAHRKRVEEANEDVEHLAPEVRFIKGLLEAWLGRVIDLGEPVTEDVDVPEPIAIPSEEQVRLAEQPRQEPVQAEPERVGWGLEVDHREIYHESEDTSFASQGVIETADGHRIDFTMKLEMSRSFTEERAFNLRLGDARLVDPLVLNFDGAHTQLSDRTFTFDLDADGTVENLNFVEAGSGYLVLDKNGDGTINDGTEMFGAVTGDGFGELAAYDQDGNGWIDEGDDVFGKLKVWKQDGLHALAAANVGAIYLKAADTPFALTEGSEQRAQIQQTGVFVKEDYSVGTIQKVDYVV